MTMEREMSAFMVSNAMINKVVNALRDFVPYYANRSDEYYRLLGIKLQEMNRRALSSRYGQDDGAEPFKFMHDTIFTTNARTLCPLLSQVSCYLYQCSEGEVSEEALFLHVKDAEDAIKDAIIESLPENKGHLWGNAEYPETEMTPLF